MSINELEKRIEKMQEWEQLAQEAAAEAEAIKDTLKQELLERNTEELVAGKFILRWTSVTSNRFDSSAFKKVHGDLYKAFCKAVESRRFSVSAEKESALCRNCRCHIESVLDKSRLQQYNDLASKEAGGYHINVGG